MNQFTKKAMTKLVRQLRKGDAARLFCYEAGPSGYGLHRQLTQSGWDCPFTPRSPATGSRRTGATA